MSGVFSHFVISFPCISGKYKNPFLFINYVRNPIKIYGTYDMFIFCNSLGFSTEESILVKFIPNFSEMFIENKKILSI